MREPLAEPPLYAALGHENQLFGEGIWRRSRQQGSQPVGKQVGALRSVKEKTHRGRP